eukprot:2460796-Karenia_brevis.AAC.1
MIVCAQEAGVLQDDIADAQRWARSRKWKSLFLPAAPGGHGQTSCGVAVFVREELGLRWPAEG